MFTTNLNYFRGHLFQSGMSFWIEIYANNMKSPLRSGWMQVADYHDDWFRVIDFFNSCDYTLYFEDIISFNGAKIMIKNHL